MPAMDDNEFDLIALPGGQFVMGSDADRRDERPAHAVMVGAFLVERRPVSNAQYARYVEAAGVAPPPFWAQEGFCDADQPVVGVSWHDTVGVLRVAVGAERDPLPPAHGGRARIRGAWRNRGRGLARDR